jgi:hypothetical protein
MHSVECFNYRIVLAQCCFGQEVQLTSVLGTFGFAGDCFIAIWTLAFAVHADGTAETVEGL